MMKKARTNIMSQLFRLKKSYYNTILVLSIPLGKMLFEHYMEASHSVMLPNVTSESRRCGRCGVIVARMHGKRMNSTITHRGEYRAVGLCEPCNIENDFELLFVKLNIVSRAWRDLEKRDIMGDGCGFTMSNPGAGILQAIIECLVGGTSEEERENRAKAYAVHTIACMRGNLRLLTYQWDKSDPAIQHNPKMLFLARDLMQKIISFIFPRT